MRSKSARDRASCVVLLLVLLVPAQWVLPAPFEVIERIVAAVDGEPVLASEVDVMARLRGLPPQAVLEALIDEILMFREASRLPQSTPSAAEMQGALASLRERSGAAADALPPAGLERIARREATILKYAGFRFAPQVRVESDEVREAYDKEAANGADQAPFDERAPALRAELQARKLGERIEAWVKELRASAHIRYNEGE
jgi:hypothetical protein